MVDALCRWYLKNARCLPWRQTQDPYAIWVSEVMLQQTQVATVIPYYHRFLTQFPTIQSLAQARESEVLSLWSGLGYYRRARNLQKGARFLLTQWEGRFPRSRTQLLEVPGIGPYTAGAILSIAFDLAEPLVDGNVQRVFARFYGIRKPIQLKAIQERFWKTAADWVANARSPRVLNQALMELGATVCTKGQPHCERCPLRKECIAHAKGWQTVLPMKKPQRQKIDLLWMGFVWEADGHILLDKNPKETWWSHLWDVPRIELQNEQEAEIQIRKLLEKNPQVKTWRELNRQRHTVTHHRIQIRPFHIHLTHRIKHKGTWFPKNKVTRLPISSLVRKMLASMLESK